MRGSAGRPGRHTGIFLDVVYVVLGILIIALGVFSFINPEGNMALFPLVFILAAVLNATNALFVWKSRGRDRQLLYRALLQGVLAAGLLALGVLSVVSLWL